MLPIKKLNFNNVVGETNSKQTEENKKKKWVHYEDKKIYIYINIDIFIY